MSIHYLTSKINLLKTTVKCTVHCPYKDPDASTGHIQICTVFQRFRARNTNMFALSGKCIFDCKLAGRWGLSISSSRVCSQLGKQNGVVVFQVQFKVGRRL